MGHVLLSLTEPGLDLQNSGPDKGWNSVAIVMKRTGFITLMSNIVFV